jgi:hypothetical protein
VSKAESETTVSIACKVEHGRLIPAGYNWGRIDERCVHGVKMTDICGWCDATAAGNATDADSGTHHISSIGICECKRCGYQWTEDRPQDAPHSCFRHVQELYWAAVEQARNNRWWFNVDATCQKHTVNKNGRMLYTVSVIDSVNRSGFANKLL